MRRVLHQDQDGVDGSVGFLQTLRGEADVDARAVLMDESPVDDEAAGQAVEQSLELRFVGGPDRRDAVNSFQVFSSNSSSV